MDNPQIWIYVIVGLIYLVSRFFKKEAEQPTDFPDPNPENPARRFDTPTDKPATSSRPKALTFEELLQEITQAKTKAPVEPPVQEPYVNYDEEVPLDEAQDLEDVRYNYRQDKVVQEYEDAKVKAFQHASLEDTLRFENTEITFGKFKAFEEEKQENPLDRYINDIYDADSLKKAVVLSEILKTKFWLFKLNLTKLS